MDQVYFPVGPVSDDIMQLGSNCIMLGD